MTSNNIWLPPKPSKKTATQIEKKVVELNSRLNKIAKSHKNLVFSTSLAVDDMVLLDAIEKSSIQTRIFTLNTGKLPAETLAVLTRAQNQYSSFIEEVMPDHNDLEEFFRKYNDFSDIYNSVETRQNCCNIRKVLPLKRGLKDADAWITGRRRDQGVTRSDMGFVEKDKEHNLVKYNPLYDWSEELIWVYAQANDVPINELHNCGFPSIGCEPCTRAVRIGEDIRSGRWWWESADTKECGIHIHDDSPANN